MIKFWIYLCGLCVLCGKCSFSRLRPARIRAALPPASSPPAARGPCAVLPAGFPAPLPFARCFTARNRIGLDEFLPPGPEFALLARGLAPEPEVLEGIGETGPVQEIPGVLSLPFFE